MANIAQAIPAASNQQKAAWKQARDLYDSYPAWIDNDLTSLQTIITNQVQGATDLAELKTVVENLFHDVGKVAYCNAQAVRFLLKYLKGYTLD